MRRLRWLVQPSSPSRSGSPSTTPGTCPCSTRRRCTATSSTPPSTRRCSPPAWGSGSACSGRCPSPRGSAPPPGSRTCIVVRFASTVIANVFLWSSSPFCPDYVELARAHGIDAAADQSLAGAIWMIEGSIVTICVLGWLFVRWMRQGEEAQELVEHARARGIELDLARARRAVAAGAGARLRARLDSEDGAAQQHDTDDDGGDGDHVEQEAERLRLRAQRVRCTALDDVDREVDDDPHHVDEVPVDARHLHAAVGLGARSGRGTTGSSRTAAASGRWSRARRAGR